MGWNDVDRKTGGGRYLSLEDGETKRVRILDEEPHTILLHKISQNVDGEEVFITVPATLKADDDFVNAATNRYPPVPQHNLRVLVYDEDGDPDQIMVLSGGVQIFRPLKAFYQRYGDVREFDIEITRDGEKRDTKYSVTMCPKSHEIDLDEWSEKLSEDESLAWDTLFPPITAEEQEKMIDEAGIDITYDPVLEIMEDMDIDEALGTRLTFGKYGPDKFPPKGKTIGEVLAIDSGWLEWAAENVTSDDTVAAAARMAVQHMGEIEAGTKKGRKALPKGKKVEEAQTPPRSSKSAGKGKKAAPVADPEPEDENDASDELEALMDEWPLKKDPGDYLRDFPKGPQAKLAKQIVALRGEDDDEPDEEEAPKSKARAKGKKGEVDRDALIKDINKAFDASDRFSEAMEIVDVIKKHGNGKTKIKDLTVPEMQALLEEISE